MTNPNQTLFLTKRYLLSPTSPWIKLMNYEQSFPLSITKILTGSVSSFYVEQEKDPINQKRVMGLWSRFALVLAVLNHHKVTGSPITKTKQGCGDKCQKECLSVHNAYRANYGAQPLELDDRLATQAQAQISKGVLSHSDWSKANGGESVAWGSVFPTFTSAIKGWHDERVNFDFENEKPLNDAKVFRNFLQIVWKGARKIGCARGSLYGKPWYVVHYDKAPVTDDAETVRENIGKPKQDDMEWFRNSSPFAKDFENPRQV